MDIFHEQLVKIKQTPTVIIFKIVIWIMTVLIAVVSFYAAITVNPLLFFISAAVIYLAYKSTASFNIEYEYSVTNGIFDIDKIINKSTRKHLYTFDCKQIESIEKYEYNKKAKNSYKLCTDDFENALVVFVNIGTEKAKIVISPNEKIIDNIKMFLPRTVGFR